MTSKDVKISIDPKKDEFKTYLDRSKISDKLAEIIIALYEGPDKPETPEEFNSFISKSFTKKDDLDTIYLKNEVLRLKEACEEKDSEIKLLKDKIAKYKAAGAEVDED